MAKRKEVKDEKTFIQESRESAIKAGREFKAKTSVTGEWFEYDARKLRKVTEVAMDGKVIRRHRTFVGLLKQKETKAFVAKLKKETPELLKIAV